MDTKPIVIAGGMNVDLVVKAPQFPRPGETVMGDSFYKSYGGKGANQATTVAHLGVPVSFIGRVGDDEFGLDMIAHMRAEGIDTTHMKAVASCASGVAMIFVDAEAQNEIVVVSGANRELRPGDITAAESTIAGAAAVVAPFDIPMDTVRELVRLASKHGVPVIINPAPAPEQPVDPAFLKQIDILVPNEIEAEALTGIHCTSAGFAARAANRLRERGVRTAIVTLGERGSVLADERGQTHIPTFEVAPVDTTAAGDAFIGALAAGYRFFTDLKELIRFASAVAALSVTKKGAAASLPDRKEVEEFLSAREPKLAEVLRSMPCG
jgi:ribokinase